MLCDIYHHGHRRFRLIFSKTVPIHEIKAEAVTMNKNSCLFMTFCFIYDVCLNNYCNIYSSRGSKALVIEK